MALSSRALASSAPSSTTRRAVGVPGRARRRIAAGRRARGRRHAPRERSPRLTRTILPAMVRLGDEPVPTPALSDTGDRPAIFHAPWLALMEADPEQVEALARARAYRRTGHTHPASPPFRRGPRHRQPPDASWPGPAPGGQHATATTVLDSARPVTPSCLCWEQNQEKNGRGGVGAAGTGRPRAGAGSSVGPTSSPGEAEPGDPVEPDLRGRGARRILHASARTPRSRVTVVMTGRAVARVSDGAPRGGVTKARCTRGLFLGGRRPVEG